jgi:hypothetical protein
MVNILFAITSVVDYLGMGISLWLALYLLARGFPSRVTIRAVIVLLSLFVFFLSASLNLRIQIPGTTALRAVMVTVGLSVWCDLTQKLLPQKVQNKNRWVITVIYILGGITVALLISTPEAFVLEKTNLIYVGRMQLGFQYTVYGITELITSLAILYNLQSGRKAKVGQPNPYFAAASILAVCVVGYGILALALTPPMPRLVQDGFIASAVVFLGISVARHQTLVERRTSLNELPVYTLVMVILTAVYAFTAWQWSHSEVIVILATALAVFTHSLFGLVGEMVSQSINKRESEYRYQLRHLGQHQSGGISMQNRLEDGLKLLCDILGATGGFIATRQSDLLVVTASYESILPGEKIFQSNVTSDEAYQPSAEFADTIAWMAPAFKEDEQLALIGLGHPKARHHYSADDLDLLAEAADRVASIVALAGIQPGEVNPQKSLQSESEDLITTLVTNPDPKFLKMVEDALRKLSDTITLGQSPLAQELKIQADTQLDIGKALRQELVNAIEALRPEGTRPREPIPHQWENYVVLHDAYIEGVANREIMARLYTSEGTFNRIRRKALRGVARYLLEKINQAG